MGTTIAARLLCGLCRRNCVAFHWVGTLRSASMGRWVLTAGHTTNMLCTNQYQEIIQTEDDDLVGLRFAQPHGFTVQGFEGIVRRKTDGHEEQYGR